MLNQIGGIHHITSLASDPQQNNAFFTGILGLRRVKKTVNFDRPDVYHLYYGNKTGLPGTVITYFPFPGAERGAAGTGEVATTVFAIPSQSLEFWENRLKHHGLAVMHQSMFEQNRICFEGPDGERLALVEVEKDGRVPWATPQIPIEMAIRGFHSAVLTVKHAGQGGKLLEFMGFTKLAEAGAVHRYQQSPGNGAQIVDLHEVPDGPSARQGAGSVHHIAFAVKNRTAQQEVRDALIGAGYQVTDVKDRNYFWAIYFRTEDGVLFEIATDEPGFEADEDISNLGEALKLPKQHEHLRSALNSSLLPIDNLDNSI